MNIDELFEHLTKLNINLSGREISSIWGMDEASFSRKRKAGTEIKYKNIEQLEKKLDISLIKTKPQKENTYTNIPVYGDVSASCGYGAIVNNENQTAVYPVATQILKYLGVDEKYCDMIFASGDSMEPVITHGDALMLDRSKREVIDGQIYIIRYDNELMCKRLQKLPPKRIKVISDNKKYESYTIDLSEPEIDFEIIGRVMWYSRVAR